MSGAKPLRSGRSDTDAEQRLVLASSSVYRRDLLRWLNTSFSWQAPDIDETPRASESPDELVRRLSIAKARAIAPAFDRHYIIGSDQIALNGMEILAKPDSRERAAEQLAAASGRVVRFLTGLCVLASATGTCQGPTIWSRSFRK